MKFTLAAITYLVAVAIAGACADHFMRDHTLANLLAVLFLPSIPLVFGAIFVYWMARAARHAWRR